MEVEVKPVSYTTEWHHNKWAAFALVVRRSSVNLEHMEQLEYLGARN